MESGKPSQAGEDMAEVNQHHLKDNIESTGGDTVNAGKEQMGVIAVFVLLLPEWL